MKKTFERLAIGASMAIGLGAIATTPANAVSITGVNIGGTAPSDYWVYDANNVNTFLVPSTPANAQKVLDGNATKPTGNVELAASSETAGFNFNKYTTLEGKIGGKDITLSSLTASDWFNTGSGLNYNYGANNLATRWFKDFLAKAGQASSPLAGLAYSNFFNLKGFQRTSDPNISYVNQDDITGLIKIGLAGHLDLKAYYASDPLFGQFAQLLPNKFQASEVVKYTYDGKTDFLYSFSATPTGLTVTGGSDTLSHNGNYEVTIKGVPPKTVPEPTTIVGILVVAGFGITMKKSARTIQKG
ncbi:hypothetical protein NIES4074_14060 [Cylindrospermum sp. NIES-4074]|nr:hypothetical protein NIES4074_14060 [Cylindrospermum sp. NIES-4074]